MAHLYSLLCLTGGFLWHASWDDIWGLPSPCWREREKKNNNNTSFQVSFWATINWRYWVSFSLCQCSWSSVFEDRHSWRNDYVDGIKPPPAITRMMLQGLANKQPPEGATSFISLFSPRDSIYDDTFIHFFFFLTNSHLLPMSQAHWATVGIKADVSLASVERK